ncbi:hypothetical protein AVEN_76283-1 [Araneus ventricosus]|uniref:Uncharacterized protein n=1 Tax=Araneus ventricosus TaxID=182803 RepID=A0A4Y2U9T5_ARAVE|nr:hypothetical protein AVEN_76283-1 [Araneus ventricosus]
MTWFEPFGKLAERFASQQETRFSVRFLVRFPQAFIASLFQAFLKLVSGFPKACFMPFQKIVKSSPSAEKIELPSTSEAVFLQRGTPSFTTFQSRTPKNFKFLRVGDRTRVP